MGGQAGGMVNETGEFPEFCKKSIQAMGADLQPPIATSFWERHPLDRLASMSPRQLEHCGRLAHPVVREPGTSTYQETTWDRALDLIADKYVRTKPDNTFFYVSGRSSNEAGFLLQLFARLYGTNNVNNCSYYCHQASGVGLASVTGSGTATVMLEDLDLADLVFVIGANPASNHPRLMKSLMKVRRRGGDVIVINTIREPGLERFSVPSDPRSLVFGSNIASKIVQPHIGGDLALILGMAKHLIETDRTDEAFIKNHTRGFTAFKDHVESLSWSKIEQQSGLTREEIVATTDMYARADRVIFSWAMGITHHAHGTATVQAIAALAMLRGQLGKPGSGLMPIRGHSNVQGIGSVGVTPTLKKAIFDRLSSSYGLDLPTGPGLDTMGCMEASESGQMRIAFNLGGNLFGSNPDSGWAARAMSELDLQVFMSTTLNTGPARAAKTQIILPVLARDEEPVPTTQESMFNFVRMSDGGEPRFDGPRSEVAILADIAGRITRKLELRQSNQAVPEQAQQMTRLQSLKWGELTDTAGIRSMIATVVPGWKALSDMDSGGPEFQIEGRTFHTPRFGTEDGRAVFHTTPLPSLDTAKEGLRLMTIRSEGQFNTVVYEEEDTYRGPDRRDVILLHPDDIKQNGLTDGARVTIAGPAGRMPYVKVFGFERIKPGSAAMYFPEANILLDRSSDPKSRTPAFKGTRITLHV